MMAFLRSREDNTSGISLRLQRGGLILYATRLCLYASGWALIMGTATFHFAIIAERVNSTEATTVNLYGGAS